MSNNRITWLSSDAPAEAFPDIDQALQEPDGLLAAGGDLAVDRMLLAYRCGIFPWYEEGQPVLWWSPDPRCVLRPEGFHVARRLARSLRQSRWNLRFNGDFPQVIRACAAPRKSQAGTWITADIIRSFEQLHAQGWAHSAEIRDGETLIGGVYGLAIGRVFFGESMFSKRSNASKFALLGLSRVLAEHGFELIDCQVANQHLLSLGASLLPRSEFRRILERACHPQKAFENWPDAPIKVSDLRIQAAATALQ